MKISLFEFFVLGGKNTVEEIEQIIDIKDGDSIAKLRKHLDETRERIDSNLENQLKAVASFMKLF